MSAASSSAVSEPALSEIARVVDTFVAPTKTFRDILRRASWWLPLVLLLVTGFGYGYVVDREVGFAQVVETVIKSSPRAQERMNQLPVEQRAPAITRQAMLTRYLTYGSAVPVLGSFAIYSLILWASFNFGLGATTRYGQVFAVVIYAALPYVLRSFLAVLILLFGHNEESFDLKNPVGSNPSYFLPDAAPWLRALLQRADVFELWVLALTVLGTSIVARKSLGEALAVVGGLYLVGTLVSVGFAAAF